MANAGGKNRESHRRLLLFLLLANGHLNELLYECGQIDTSPPFSDLDSSAHLRAREADHHLDQQEGAFRRKVQSLAD